MGSRVDRDHHAHQDHQLVVDAETALRLAAIDGTHLRHGFSLVRVSFDSPPAVSRRRHPLQAEIDPGRCGNGVEHLRSKPAQQQLGCTHRRGLSVRRGEKLADAVLLRGGDWTEFTPDGKRVIPSMEI